MVIAGAPSRFRINQLVIRGGNFTLIPILRVPRLEDGLTHGGKGCGEGRAAVRVLSAFFKGQGERAEPPRIKARGLGERYAPQRGEREGAAAPSHEQGGSGGPPGPPARGTPPGRSRPAQNDF